MKAKMQEGNGNASLQYSEKYGILTERDDGPQRPGPYRLGWGQR